MNALTLLISSLGNLVSVMILLAIGSFIFWISTMVEIASANFRDDVTKIAWLLIVIFTGVLGALIYWIAGRRSRIPV